jgi:hypothetical protein
VHRTSFFGRVRGSVGLGAGLALDLAWTPPIEFDGAKPNFLAAALSRPFSLSQSWRLGLRGYGQIGKIEADITCSADDVAGGNDLDQNPFLCVEPSQDESCQSDRAEPSPATTRADASSPTRWPPPHGPGFR